MLKYANYFYILIKKKEHLMKNVQLFFCILFISIALHGMEQNNQLTNQKQENNPWKAIDCSIAQKALESDCNNYLKNRLEEYKKVDFAPKDMEHINFICTQITGRPNILIYNNGHGIKDDKKNGFLHIAIHKADLAIVTWLLDNKCWTYFANAQGKEPLDLCIDKLLPTAVQKNKNVTFHILDTLMNGYAKAGFSTDYRKKFVTKLIAWELEHKKNGTNSVLKDSWINLFITCYSCIKSPNKLGKCYGCVYLADIYQTVTDTQENSYTHILVQQRLADQLYDFIQKGYISFTRNKENKNPLDIALEHFHYCIHNDLDSTITKSARCCLFMLLNYVKKQQGITDYQQCCPHHTI